MKRQRVGDVEDAGMEMFKKSVGSSVQKIADALITLNTLQTAEVQQPLLDPTSAQRATGIASMEDMEKALSLIDNLEAKQMQLLNLPDGTPMKEMQLEVNRMAIEKAYGIMPA